MEMADFSKMFVPIYQNMKHHISKDHKLELYDSMCQ